MASTASTAPISLYYFGSPNSRKITIMLEELGVPYTLVPIMMSRGDPKREDYMKLAPSQKMPLIRPAVVRRSRCSSPARS